MRNCRRAALPAFTQIVQQQAGRELARHKITYLMKICVLMTELFKQKKWQEAKLYRTGSGTTPRPKGEPRTTQTQRKRIKRKEMDTEEK